MITKGKGKRRKSGPGCPRRASVFSGGTNRDGRNYTKRDGENTGAKGKRGAKKNPESLENTHGDRKKKKTKS